MCTVSFPVHGKFFSYGRFYTGFGLFVTAFLLFCAFVAWQLGKMAQRRSPELAQPIAAVGWSLAALQAVSLVLSWMYFSAAPALFSALAAASLARATTQVQSARA